MEIKTIKNRAHVIADEGICTNGEIYGSEIILAEGMTAEGFYEISFEEYEKISKTISETVE